jgi:hypothetical protein
MTDVPAIPPEAVRLALAARRDALIDRPDPTVLSDETLTRIMLEAAAPFLAADLTEEQWRTGRTLGRTMYARTGGTGRKADTEFGMLDTREIAARACDDHNAVLDLAWLARAGFDVTLSWRAGTWRVEIPSAPYGALVMCGQGETPGEALAKAREWAEGRPS